MWDYYMSLVIVTAISYCENKEIFDMIRFEYITHQIFPNKYMLVIFNCIFNGQINYQTCGWIQYKRVFHSSACNFEGSGQVLPEYLGRSICSGEGWFFFGSEQFRNKAPDGLWKHCLFHYPMYKHCEIK